MGLIACRCGHQISNVIGPCPDGHRLISEAKIDNLRETGLAVDEVLSELFLRTTKVYKCPRCERMLVEEEPNSYKYFRLDP